MNKLKKRRTPLRSSFTRTLNALEEYIKGDPLDRGIILDGFTKLEKMIKEIKTIDDAIMEVMVDDEQCDEEAIDKEVVENECYSDEFITMKRKVSEVLRITKPNQDDNESNSDYGYSKPKTYKLPKLNIKPFDSQLINYLSFWSQFEKIHEDLELDNSDKFQYLIQSVEPGTSARRLLESYPMTSVNYPKAVEAFQERFGNKDLLIEVYVREFLKLVVSNVLAHGKDKLPLSDLFTKVEAYLRSLESMGLSLESNSAWLYPMIESSLSEDVMRAWQRYSISNRSNVDSTSNSLSTKSNIVTLMEFLKQEVAGEERLKLAKSGFVELVSRDKPKENFRKEEHKLPTAAGLFSAKERLCLFCDKSHESKDCVRSRSLSFQERKTKIRDKNCCLKCLRFGHHAKVCKVFICCHVCSKPHTELLCPEISMRKETENIAKAPDVIQSNIANNMCSGEVALMTLEIVIKCRFTKKVRALLDCGSQKSYILKSTAKELGLLPISSEAIVHTLFGGAQTEAKSHNKFQVQLSAPGRRNQTEEVLECLDQDIIFSNIPRILKESVLKELKENKLWITEIGTGSPKIEILIGSDYYGQILTGRVKQLKSGLTAIQTKLGWTLCGCLERTSQSCLNYGNMLITNLALKEIKIPDLRKLETIGITNPSLTLSKSEVEELAHDKFIKEVDRKREGRYTVGLPWINSKREFPSNRHMAERRNDQWGTFVGNRVREICKFSDFQLWNFVPGHLNPADPPSRACNPKQLLKMRWWEGLEWLKSSEEKWPQSEINPNEELVMTEKKKITLATLLCSNSHEFMRHSRISKFAIFINVICWVKRFILKSRDRNRSFPSELSIEEKEDAEKLLWCRIQSESFCDTTDAIKGLKIMKDQEGLLREKTKILEGDDEFSFRYPILLPSRHHVVNCLIKEMSPIKRKFIPPTVAWWGGWWERLIKCVKIPLIRTHGTSTLTFEELMTVLCDVEVTVNKIHLTYIFEEIDKFVPLIPSSFLQDIDEIGVPDLDMIDSNKLHSRYKHCQNIRQQLRNRFRNEYLAELVQKSKEKGQVVRQGEVVLIELNQKRLHWPIGKIIKIFPSRDGAARVAEVKTSSGTLVRTHRKLYPLEISSPEDPVIQIVKINATRSGRVVKRRVK